MSLIYEFGQQLEMYIQTKGITNYEWSRKCVGQCPHFYHMDLIMKYEYCANHKDDNKDRNCYECWVIPSVEFTKTDFALGLDRHVDRLLAIHL